MTQDTTKWGWAAQGRKATICPRVCIIRGTTATDRGKADASARDPKESPPNLTREEPHAPPLLTVLVPAEAAGSGLLGGSAWAKGALRWKSWKF